MPIKNDVVISYIESLSIGSKISVRGLASELDVSEGTVYKAIKSAEARGLVVTRPKAGTFRIDSEQSGLSLEISIIQLSRILGLTLRETTGNADKIIKGMIVCDSDEVSIKNKLINNSEPDSLLCLVGNRPEIHEIVINSGAHLLVTDGNQPSELLRIIAERNGLCVLTSLQNTYSLLRLFDNFLKSGNGGLDGTAKDWMQEPYHLYHNDITADWQKIYRSIPGIVSQYPVVDDELKICGALDIAKAFAANPSQKISGVLTMPDDYFQIEAGTMMKDIVERMVLSGKSIAVVVDEGKMSGLVTANDLLRYYLYSGQNGTRCKYESFLQETKISSSKEQSVYSVHFPDEECSNFSESSLLIMLTAAKRHAETFFHQLCELENGTFFATNLYAPKDDMMLTSIISKNGEKTCALEVEIHDETQSYTKAILMFSHK